MTNKFFSSVDGIRIRVASVMHRCCHRSASVSFMSGQSLLTTLLLSLTLFIGTGQMWGANTTINASTVVSGTGYKTHSTSDWIITFGGNNSSVGTNSSNRSKCNLSNYSKYAVSPVTTSSVASAFVSLNSISDINKVSYTFSSGSNQTSTKVYLIYSSNGTTFSQMTLTKGTQGHTISSGTELEFAKSTGYFGLLFESTNSSGNWRIDAVSITFYEAPSKTLSSIAITTQPTTKKYIVGDTFNKAGAVVTATYSDATSANVASATTWTPTTGLVAGNNTMTASYTEGGVTKTATTTVTAYSVTVQKQDETGATITADGVSASASGRTLSASATAASKYVFKGWKYGTAAGTSIASASSASTTLNGTPTGNVTVIAEFYKPITISYKANGQNFTSQTYAYNSTLAFPASGPNGDTYSCTGKTFVGWVGEANKDYKHASTAPTYATAGGSVTTGATYYAVFADASTGASSSKTYSLVLTGNNFVQSYNERSSAATANEVGGSGTFSVSFTSNGVMKSSNSGNPIQFRKSGSGAGVLYNTTDLGTINSITYGSGSTNNIASTYKGSTQQPTSAGTGGYFKITNGSSVSYITSITINFTKTTGSGTTYSNFETTCCQPLVSINGSISWTNGTSATLTWANDVNVSGYSVTCKQGETNKGTVGDITGTTTKSCTVTGLTAGQAYTFTINASGDATHCDASQVISATAPKITATADLDDFGYAQGSNPEEQSFTVSGTALTENLTVSAPANFLIKVGTGEWSAAGGNKSITVSTPPSNLSSTTIYVKAATGLNEGDNPSGNITISGGGAANVDVPVSATITSACAVNPTIGAATLKAGGAFGLDGVAVSVTGMNPGTNCTWTDYGFYWGAGDNKKAHKVEIGNSGNATSFEATLAFEAPAQFAAGTTYYFCAYGKNAKSGAEIICGTEASFTPYTVSYNANGGTGEVATVVVNAGGSVMLPNASAFTLNCNDLTKWALNSADSETKLNPEATYSNINANAEFFAIWNVRTYTISYAAGNTPTNGGNITGSHDDDTKTCGVSLTLPGVTFYSTGYTQTGWKKTINGASKTNNLSGSYGVDADQTFYPFWTINTYNVTKGTKTGCNGNDFTLSASSVDHYGSITVTASPDAAHKGSAHVTVYPSENASVDGTTISNITGNITVSVSFAAKEAATVKLFIAGSESVVVSSALEDDSYTLPAVAAECPDLGLYGWYKGEYTHATTAPSGDNYKSKGQTVTLTAGENKFYAVYATMSEEYTNNFTEITSESALTSDQYLIGALTGPWCMKTSKKDATYMNEMGMSSYNTDGTINYNSNEDLVWVITRDGNNVTIKGNNNNKYLAINNGSLELQDGAYSYTFDYGTTKADSWSFKSVSAPTQQLIYSGYAGFTAGTAQSSDVSLYKRDKQASITGPYTTNPNCTTHELSYADPGTEGTIVLGKTVLGEGKTTTATATPSEHYTFSHWTISGTGATMSNTVNNESTDNPVTVTMGTADAEITAHFTEKPKCTVKFYNNGGSALSSTTYWLGETPTAPTLTDGHDHDACDENSTVHYGWTQTTWEETLTQTQVDAKTAADVKVYAKDATLPAIAAGDNGKTIEYHAVWAKETTTKTAGKVIDYDGSGRSTLQAITGVTVSGLGSDYANTHSPNVLKFDDSGDYIQFDLDYAPTSLSFTYKKIGGSGNSTMIIQECATSDGEYSDVESLSITGAQDATGTKTTTSPFSQRFIRMFFSKSSNVGVGTIVIQGYTGSTTYSAFLTNCCNQLDQIDGAVTIDGINENGATAHWVLADHTGISKYTLNVYKADNSFVKSVDVTDPTKRKADIAGLETCTEYYVTITTVAADGYCAGSEQGKSANFTTNGWAVHYTSENDETALLSNVTKLTGEDYMCLGEDNYVATFQASVGYKLPSTITVWYTGDVMDEGYTWNSATGTLTIPTADVSEEFDVRIIGECITPNITANPANAVYALNEEATPLSVTVEGAGTWCGYQWQSKVGEGAWTDIPSATNSSYTPSTAAAGTTTLYRVIVSNTASGCSAFAYSEAATVEVSALPVCAQPTFSIAAGTKLGAQSVTLGCETVNATIYYTTNGNDPEEIEANRYNGSAIAINQTTTIKAIAAKSGMTTSGVASATYTIKCKAPTFSVEAGTYNDTKSVELASEYGTVYYTVDGSDPATDGVEYSEAISVTASTTIRAIAKMANCENSDEASAAYTLKCATPSFSVAAGEQIGAQSVALTSTAGANIYYTTNEATPTTSSTLYESAIPVSSAMTIKAIAVKDGWSNSDVASAAYTIKYTLTFQNNGVTLAEGGTKNLAPGEAYGTLPTLTSGACDETSTTFMGWSTAVITDKDENAPAYASAETTMGEGHVTLNAVWAKASGSAEDDQEHTWTSPTWTTQTAFGYGIEKTATIDGEDWKYAGYAQNANNYLQMNTGKTSGNNPRLSYFFLPEYDESFIVKSVAFSLISNSSAKAYFTTTKPTTDAMTPDACTNASFDNKKALDLDVEECNLTHGYIYVDNSAQVKSVTATYTKVVTYTDYITTCCDEWTATAKYGTNNIINVNDVVAVTVTGDTYGAATYESNKTDVLTVASNGTITGKKAGIARVSISWTGNVGHCAYATYVDVTVNGPITLTYNANDGSQTPATKTHSGTISSNSAFALEANTFSREGYTFQGWATTPSGAKAYDNSQANVSFAEDVTLYAVWAINSHAVTLTQPTGNTITANSSTTPGNVTYGTSVTLSATENETTTDGYIFTSWSVTGITLADATANPAQFTMPDNAVSVSANYTHYTWDLTGYTVETAPETEYSTGDHFSKASVVIKAGYERSDTKETKHVAVAAANWTAKLNGTEIADNYTFVIGDHGKTLTLWVGDTQVGENYVLTVNAIPTDHFVINIWTNEVSPIADKTIAYSMPSLSDQTAGEAATCKDHNLFVGWVEADYKDEPEGHIVAANTAMTPSDKTFYAVWGKTGTITESISYGWESTDDASNWSMSASKDGLNAVTAYHKTGEKAGATTSTGAHIRTLSSYATPKSISAQILKQGGNTTTGNVFKLQYSNNASDWNDIVTKEFKDLTKEVWFELSYDLSNNDTYKNKYFRVVMVSAANGAIDDVTFTYATSGAVDYITDCVQRYQITFDANGGTGSYDALEKKEGATVTLPDGSALSRAADHYHFNGWKVYYTSTDVEIPVSNNQFTMPGSAVDAVAQWEEDPKGTVRYVGDVITNSSVTRYAGQTYDLRTEVTLPSSNMKLVGWKLDGDETLYAPGRTMTMPDPVQDYIYHVQIIDQLHKPQGVDFSDGEWVIVTNENQLQAGDFVVIVANETTNAMGAQGTSNRGVAGVTKNNDGTKITLTENVAKLFLQYGYVDGEFALYDMTEGGYLYANSNSANQVKTTADYSNRNYSWSITIGDGNIASIVAQGANTHNDLKYNPNNGSPLFSCYTSGMTAVQLYRYEGHKTVEITDDVNASAIYLDDADIVVKDGKTLTIDEASDLDNLTVEAGGKVSGSANLTVNNLTIESEAGKSGQVMDANKVTANAVYMNVTFYKGATALNATTADRWYMISAPFDVNLSNGFFQTNGTPMVFGTDFDLFEYDGSKRAATGTTGWQRAQGKMKAGVACLIGFNADQPTTIRLKAASAVGEPESIALQAFDGDDDNKNWNGVANPTLHYTDINKDVQTYNNEDGENGRKYIAYTAASTSFVVGTAFFVQETGSIDLSTATHDQFRAPKRAEANERYEACVRLFRQEATEFADQMYVRASESAMSEYEQGHDMITWNDATGKTAMIWAENYGMRLAIEEAPLVNDKASYELGIFAPAEGAYRIEANDTYDNAALYLTYNGKAIWNLSMSACELDLAKGLNEGYGLRLVAKMPQTPTGIDDVQSDKVQCTKVVLDDHVYILRGGKMYDVTGKAVR